MPRFDFLIAGGGVSGLSLACHLARAFPGRSIAVVDKNPRDLDKRNLSYWSRRPTLWDAHARGDWSRLVVRTDRFDRTFELGEYRYRSVRGADFAAAAHRLLEQHPAVSRVEAEVTELRDDSRGAALAAGGEWLEGEWLFDGRLLAEDAQARPGRVLLRQHFLGWEVETERDAFDTAAPTFLDFRVGQEGATRFFYVLPFSPRHALVELVAHGEAPDEAMLAEHLAHRLGVEAYRTVAVESGASPLTDRPFRRRLGARTLAIGVHGGRLKASTGYAFTRIERDSEAIVASLRRHGHPFDLPRDRRLFRLLDTLLLRVMQRSPPRIAGAFEGLFGRNPIARVLRFLDEEATLGEVLRVGWSMPALPFLAELLAWPLRRAAR